MDEHGKGPWDRDARREPRRQRRVAWRHERGRQAHRVGVQADRLLENDREVRFDSTGELDLGRDGVAGELGSERQDLRRRRESGA